MSTFLDLVFVLATAAALTAALLRVARMTHRLGAGRER